MVRYTRSSWSTRCTGLLEGDDLDGQLVDLAELGILGKCRAGHAGELVIEPEVVLEGDGGEGLVLTFDAYVFLGLDGLMEPLE